MILEKFIEGVEKYFNNKYGVSIDDITDNNQIEDAWVAMKLQPKKYKMKTSRPSDLFSMVEEFCEYLAEKYDLTPIQ